jgi:hypothetical protein
MTVKKWGAVVVSRVVVFFVVVVVHVAVNGWVFLIDDWERFLDRAWWVPWQIYLS